MQSCSNSYKAVSIRGLQSKATTRTRITGIIERIATGDWSLMENYAVYG